MNDIDHDGAEMPLNMKRVMTTLRDHEAEGTDEVFEHVIYLWEHPEEFSTNGIAERWRNDMTLLILELGVVFGIEYERAYPTDRQDEWPVPLEVR